MDGIVSPLSCGVFFDSCVCWLALLTLTKKVSSRVGFACLPACGRRAESYHGLSRVVHCNCTGKAKDGAKEGNGDCTFSGVQGKAQTAYRVSISGCVLVFCLLFRDSSCLQIA